MMVDNILKSQAFKLKGRLYTLTVLHLQDINSQLFKQQLADVVAKAPRLFERTPVVLDFSAILNDSFYAKEFSLQVLCESAREFVLLPIGVQGGNPFLNTLAQAQNLAILNGSSTQDKSWIGGAVVTEKSVSLPEQPVPETIKTKLLTTPVRSGQQVVSKGGDLVITSSVSHGAELLADGNIHVYGALRGRALAGITGDKQARIFCHSLDAELVSIAGYYRLSDAIEPITVPCQIFIHDDRIQIEPL